ncbi:MAG: hypothetical protein V3575_04225, partial [Candidatus Absconditabacteria bacterium]
MVKPIEIIKKGFLQGIGLSLGLSIFVFGIFLVKGAWQSANPTAGQGDANNLYTSGDDTLTKEKWNALVEKVNTNNSNSLGWEDVDINDTTTPFDLSCQRRWLRNDPGNTTSSIPRGLRYADYLLANGNDIYFREGTTRYSIS